jgi:hypothetical protein
VPVPRPVGLGCEPLSHFLQIILFYPKHSPSIILPVIYSTFQDTDRSSQKTNILYSKKDRSSQTCLSLGLSASDANPSHTFYRLHHFSNSTLHLSIYQSFTAHFKIQTYNSKKCQNHKTHKTVSDRGRQAEDPAGWTPPNIFKRKRRTTTK